MICPLEPCSYPKMLSSKRLFFLLNTGNLNLFLVLLLLLTMFFLLSPKFQILFLKFQLNFLFLLILMTLLYLLMSSQTLSTLIQLLLNLFFLLNLSLLLNLIYLLYHLIYPLFENPLGLIKSLLISMIIIAVQSPLITATWLPLLYLPMIHSPLPVQVFFIPFLHLSLILSCLMPIKFFLLPRPLPRNPHPMLKLYLIHCGKLLCRLNLMHFRLTRLGS